MILNGRSTAPQVRILRDKFPVKRGDKVTKQQIAQAIGEEIDSNRWLTVVQAWRKQVERETGIYLRALPKEGYEACAGDDQVRGGMDKTRTAVRCLQRGVERASVVPEGELTEGGRMARLHMTMRLAPMIAGMRTAVKESRKLLSTAAPPPKAG